MGNPFSSIADDSAALLKPDLVKFNQLMAEGIDEIKSFRVSMDQNVDKVLDTIDTILKVSDYELDRMTASFNMFQKNFFFFYPLFAQICILYVVTFYYSKQRTGLFSLKGYLANLKYFSFLSSIALLLLIVFAIITEMSGVEILGHFTFFSLLLLSFNLLVVVFNLTCKKNAICCYSAIPSLLIGFGSAVVLIFVVSKVYISSNRGNSFEDQSANEETAMCPENFVNFTSQCFTDINQSLQQSIANEECALSRATLPKIQNRTDLEQAVEAAVFFKKTTVWVSAKAVNGMLYRWSDNSFIDSSFWCKKVQPLPALCAYLDVNESCLKTIKCDDATINVICARKLTPARKN